MSPFLDRLREAAGSLEPWQRAVLGVLAGATALGLVAVFAVAAIRAGRGEDRTTSTTTATTVAPPSTTTTSATTTITEAATTTTTLPTTTTTADPAARLTLRPDGIGPLDFGVEAEAAVVVVRTLLGPPDSDTGWVDQASTYGNCLGTQVRFVRWRSLELFLTDGPSDWAGAGVRHLASWAHSAAVGEPLLMLRTAEGVGVGTPVGDLRATYGETLEVGEDPLFGAFFRVQAGGPAFLIGRVTGTAAADRVESLSAGFACGE